MSHIKDYQKIIKNTVMCSLTLTLVACGGELSNSENSVSPIPSSTPATTLLSYAEQGVSDGENISQQESEQNLASLQDAELQFASATSQNPDVDGLIIHFKTDNFMGASFSANGNNDNINLVDNGNAYLKSAVQSSIPKWTKAAQINLQPSSINSQGAVLLGLNSIITQKSASELSNKILNSDSRIDYIEPNILFKRATISPNQTITDKKFLNQWGLNQWSPYFAETGKSFGVNPLPAWSKNTGLTSSGAGVVVAVLDTGAKEHEDLSGKYLPGFDFVSNAKRSKDGNGRDADATDPGDSYAKGFCGNKTSQAKNSWHGTKVASIIAASVNNTNNGSPLSGGMVGVAPDAKILPVRVMGPCGAALADVAAGIVWAAGGAVAGVPINQNPAKVISLSVEAPSKTCSKTLSNAIAFAKTRGAVVVVPAGNSTKVAGQNANFVMPANCSEAVTVASTKSSGVRANFSNFGSVVDASAPGEDIVVASFNANGTSDFVTESGSSLAAAHVAGVMALMYASQPNISTSKASALLKLHVTPFPASNTGGGTGIVNAAKVVALLNSMRKFIFKDDFLEVKKSQIIWLSDSGEAVAGTVINANSQPELEMSSVDGLFLDHDNKLIGSGRFTSGNRTDALIRNNSGKFDTVVRLGIVSVVPTPFMVSPLDAPLGSGDFNADGKEDFAYRNTATGQIVIRLMVQNQAPAVMNLNVANTLTFKGLADINADGFTDFVFQKKDGTISVLYMSDSISLWSDILKMTKTQEILAVGDFNGDLAGEILLKDKKSSATTTVLIRDNVISLVKGAAVTNGYKALRVGDFNGDGKDDLITLFEDAGAGQKFANIYQFNNSALTVGKMFPTVANNYTLQ